MKFRNLLLLGVLGLFVSCGSSEKIVVNKKIINTEKEPMLLGRVTPNALRAPEFNDWFSETYDSYSPDPGVINKLKGRLRLYSIEVFFGTWSDTSQKEIPKFLKILDQSKFPQKKLYLYAVNKKNESLYGEDTQKGLTQVPTYIVYKTASRKRRGNKEIGRIIGHSDQSFEMDLYKIITDNNHSLISSKKSKKKSTKNKKSGTKVIDQYKDE